MPCGTTTSFSADTPAAANVCLQAQQQQQQQHGTQYQRLISGWVKVRSIDALRHHNQLLC
jgi:hypothetical protein